MIVQLGPESVPGAPPSRPELSDRSNPLQGPPLPRGGPALPGEAPAAPSTRDRLLRTAARLFHEQGYHATGVATILREAGAHSGSLYHHFASKEELLAEVLRWYRRNLRPILIEPVEAAEADPLERVFRLLASYRGLLERTGCVLGCPIGNLALEVSSDHPALRPDLDENFEGWREAVRGWLEAAGDRLPGDTDLDALALFVLTTMEGGIMLARARGSLEPFDRAVAVLRCHFELLGDAVARERV